MIRRKRSRDVDRGGSMGYAPHRSIDHLHRYYLTTCQKFTLLPLPTLALTTKQDTAVICSELFENNYDAPPLLTLNDHLCLFFNKALCSIVSISYVGLLHSFKSFRYPFCQLSSCLMYAIFYKFCNIL